jgi:hypothetical protein
MNRKFLVASVVLAFSNGTHCSDARAGQNEDCAPKGTPADEMIAGSNLRDIAVSASQVAEDQLAQADGVDSLFLVELKRVGGSAPESRKNVEAKFRAPSSLGLTQAQMNSAYALYERVGMGPWQSSATQNLTTEQRMAEIRRWSADPTISRETQLFFMSMIGSQLAAMYDESGKTKTQEEILKWGGGQCTEIHDVIGLIGKNLTALGLEPIANSGLLWGSGNEGGLHGNVLFKDTKTGKYILQNYSQLMTIDAKSTAQALEIANTFNAPFSHAMVVSTGGRPRGWLPRTSLWYLNQLRGSKNLDAGEVEASVSQGAGNDVTIEAKPNSWMKIGYSKSGDYQIMYAGLTSETSMGKPGDRFQASSRLGVGFARQTAPDYNWQGRADAKSTQERDGLYFTGTLDSTYRLNQSSKTKSQLEAGTDVSLIGFRGMSSSLSGGTDTTGSLFSRSYLGWSKSIQDEDQRGATRFGLFRVFTGSSTQEQLRQGEGASFDFQDEFRIQRTDRMKAGERILVGKVVLPSGGKDLGYRGTASQSHGNTTLQLDAAGYRSNDNWFKDSDYLSAVIDYTAPLGRGKESGTFSFGYRLEDGNLHPSLRNSGEKVAPGIGGRQGGSLYAGFSIPVGSRGQKPAVLPATQLTFDVPNGQVTSFTRADTSGRTWIERQDFAGSDGSRFRFDYNDREQPKRIEKFASNGTRQVYEFRDGKVSNIVEFNSQGKKVSSRKPKTGESIEFPIEVRGTSM